MSLSEAGKVITRHREALRWSKRRLAREAHLSPAYIVQMENGDRPVTGRALQDIADAVGIHPYVLRGEAGLIPAEDVVEAERAAKLLIEADPAVAQSRHFDDTGGAFAWLVADYLHMLGHDAYGTDWDGPYGVDVDWSDLAPERWKALREGKVNAVTTGQIIQSLEEAVVEIERHEAKASKPPTQIEGWDELTDTQRKLVQQMVNQFRRSADSE